MTTRDNGFSEIIENGVHGSIVDRSSDSAALRDAIQFWSDESRRASARSITTERASQFDIAINVAATLKILFQSAASSSLSRGSIRKNGSSRAISKIDRTRYY